MKASTFFSAPRLLGVFAAVLVTACSSPTSSMKLPAEATPGCASAAQMPAEMMAGRETYRSLCTHCHQADGVGVPGMVPALAESSRLASDPDLGIRMIIASQSPAAHLEGMAVLDLVAPLEQLSDAEAADVLNYVLNAWGNCAGRVNAGDIGKMRLNGS